MSSVASELDDAALVAAMRSGDRDAFAALYDRYGDRLHDFCRSLMRDDAEAADVMHDTFVYAAEHIDDVREPSKVRAWLYAIARHACLKRLDKQRRHVDDTALQFHTSDEGEPDDAFARAELADLVWAAAAGLSPRDQALLDLHLRQGLEGSELADVIGESPSQTYVLLSRMRDQVERSLGALVVARVGRRDCNELSAMLADWDGTLTPLLRKRIARHIDGCETCERRRKKLVSPLALYSATPAFALPMALRSSILDAGGAALGKHGGGARPRDLRKVQRASRRRVFAFLGIGAVLFLVAGGIIATAASGNDAPSHKVAVSNQQPIVSSTSPPSTTVKSHAIARHVVHRTHTATTVPPSTNATPGTTTVTTVAPGFGPPPPGPPVQQLGPPTTVVRKSKTTTPPTTAHQGPPPLTVTVSPSSLALGNHDPDTKTVTLKIAGGVASDSVTIEYYFDAPGAAQFALSNDTCFGARPTGTACSMDVTLLENSTGKNYGTLYLQVTGSMTHLYTVSLVGDGGPSPV